MQKAVRVEDHAGGPRLGGGAEEVHHQEDWVTVQGGEEPFILWQSDDDLG